MADSLMTFVRSIVFEENACKAAERSEDGSLHPSLGRVHSGIRCICMCIIIVLDSDGPFMAHESQHGNTSRLSRRKKGQKAVSDACTELSVRSLSTFCLYCRIGRLSDVFLCVFVYGSIPGFHVERQCIFGGCLAGQGGIRSTDSKSQRKE